MTAELFVHGPRHAFYGTQDEVAYSQLFDDSSIKDEIRFIVEIRKGIDGKWYTYYNYCRYGNVTDIDGRSGAYIGLTFRLDAYYANLRAVYTILDAVFSKSVLGLLVKRAQTGFQYIVSNFESNKQEIRNRIEKPTGTLLGTIISPTEIFPIDSSFKATGKVIYLGLDDTQALGRRLSDIKSCGKIIFASSAPIEQLQVVINQCNEDKRKFAESKQQEISRLEENLAISTKEVASTSSLLRTAQKNIQDLNSEVSRLNQEISSLEEDRRNIKSLKEEKSQLSNKLQYLERKNFDLQSSATTLQDQLTKANADITDIKRRETALNDTNKELQDQINDLTKTNTKLQEENLRLRKIKDGGNGGGETTTGGNEENIDEGIDGGNGGGETTTDTFWSHVINQAKKELSKVVVFLKNNKKHSYWLILLLIAFVTGIILLFYTIDLPSKDFEEEKHAKVSGYPYIRDTNIFPLVDSIDKYISLQKNNLMIGDDDVSCGDTILATMKKDIPFGKWYIIEPKSTTVIEEGLKYIIFILKDSGQYHIAYLRNDTIIIQRQITVN